MVIVAASGRANTIGTDDSAVIKMALKNDKNKINDKNKNKDEGEKKNENKKESKNENASENKSHNAETINNDADNIENSNTTNKSTNDNLKANEKENQSQSQNQNSSLMNNKFEFPEFLLKEAEEQKLAFQKETGTLAAEEIHKAEARAKEAFAHKDWAVATSEYSRVLGKYPDNRESWLRLSIAAHNKNSQEKNYLVEQVAKKAAIQAYLLSKTPAEQAEALLVYGNTFNPADDYEYPNYQYALDFANYLSDVRKIKQANKDLANVMPFQYLQARVNTDSAPPNMCFSFSHSIDAANIQIEDYVNINPKVDGRIKIQGRDICVTSLQFGMTYDVTIKAGLQDTFGEKIKHDEKISIKVRDQDSRLSFNNKAYLLRKEENSSIPLTGVNVDVVSIKILKVSDRALDFVVGQSKDFLSKLWDYRVEQISNETGELLYSGEMDFSKEKNKTVTKQIPFSEVVKTPEPGVYIVQADEKNVISGNKASATQWLIVSDLALTTFTDSNGGITANVRSLKTADALANVELRLIAQNNSILQTLKTNRDGMAVFEPNVTTGKGGNRPLMILAYGSKGEFSFISLDLPAFDLSDRGVAGRKASGPLDAFLYTEQGVYRPGATVHVDTLLRNEKGLLPPKLPLTFKVLRSDDTIVKMMTITGNELGFYSFELPLSNSARSGQWTILAFADPKKDPIGRCQFSVEDFVPSRIAVNLKADKPYLSETEPNTVDIEARYLFGSPAVGLKGDATITLRPRLNPFPAFSGYVFGLEDDAFQNQRSQQAIPVLNNEGKAEYSIELNKLPETTRPLEAVLRVSLADQGGRPEIGSLTLPVQAKNYFIGIKGAFQDRLIPDAESEAKFEVIAVDPKGQLITVADLQYELFEENVQYSWYRPDNYAAWQYKTQINDKFLQSGQLSSLADKAQTLNLPIKDWGQYRLEIKDPKTGIASSYRFQKGWLALSNGMDAPDKLTVKVNKPLVNLDENLELQIEAPFEGQALLTIANDRVLETRNITLRKQGQSNRVKLTANDDWGVGVYCMVTAIRPLEKDSAKANAESFLPKRAIGLAWVGINPDARTLNINFDVPKEVRPRQTVEIPLQVSRKDERSLSLPLQVTVAAVDEGILKLTDFVTPKPQDYFLGQRTLGVAQRDLYGRLIDPIAGEMGVLRQGGDAGILSRNMQALSKRSFKIVSLYKGIIQPDRKGKAIVQLELPDFNGSLRLMAVAFDESRFGSADSQLLVRDPVVIEGILPRFLAPKDQSTFSVSLHNVSGAAGKYQVEIKTEGEIRLVEDSWVKEVMLEKDGTAQLQIPIEALALGEGKIQVLLKGEGLDISNSYDIVIRDASPYMNWSSAYVLKNSVCYRISDEFKNYLPGSEKIMLSISSAVPWDIGGLSKILAEYPYGCVEQITSKGMGALYVNDGSESPQANSKQVNQALAILSEKQMSSGAYNLWNSGDALGNPFLTSYVMDFYLRAKNAGYEIPEFSLTRGLDGLKQMIERAGEYKSDNLSGLAYAVYVTTKAEQLPSGTLRYFYDSYFDELDNPLARMMVATALAAKGENERAAQAFNKLYAISKNGLNTAGPFGTALRNEAGLLSLALETLKLNPSLKEAGKVASSSMEVLQKTLSQASGSDASGMQTSLLSTQELAWILLASNSLNEDKKQEPIHVVINEDVKKTNLTSLQMPISSENLKQGLQLCNEGKNDLFVNLSLTALPKEKPKAESKGITVERQYYDLEGQPIDPTKVKQGTQMIVVIKGAQENNRPHQLLVIDLLPAGFEIENTKLSSENKVYDWMPELSKVEFSEGRDDRFVAAVEMNENQNTFQVAYQVRAVTLGSYINPGVLVEDMYMPSFFARTASKTVQVVGQ